MSANVRMFFLFFATLMTHSTLSRAEETTPSVFPTRKLLGGGGVASNTPNVSPTYNQLPPPPPPSTLNQKVFKFAWNYVVDLISARGAETAAIEEMKIEEKHQTLPKTNSESEFANTLTRMANALSTEKGLARIEHGLDDFSEIDSSVHDALCRSDAFVREFNQSSFDDSYVQAFPMDGEEIPSGCYRGCILGNDWKTTIAKFYGIRRTLTFNSWRGKCFKKVVDEIDGSETTAVTNRIKLSYGPIVNALLGLNEPIELYKGDVEYDATSIFDGKAAIGINYSKFGHEFSKFRDEIREVYPGVYVGKMWMMPGLDLFPREDGTDSIFKVPENGTPQFAMNFMLMKENDDEDGTNAGSSSSVPN
tara:strand:+ start:111 stop:1199 length:1089 start_codon:yes stop_codon:yes gene_type:complete